MSVMGVLMSRAHKKEEQSMLRDKESWAFYLKNCNVDGSDVIRGKPRNSPSLKHWSSVSNQGQKLNLQEQTIFYYLYSWKCLGGKYDIIITPGNRFRRWLELLRLSLDGLGTGPELEGSKEIIRCLNESR